MPKNPIGLIEYAESSNDPDMRFIAEESVRRGMSLRDLARTIGVDHAAVCRHFDAARPRRDTVQRYLEKLGLDNRKGRVLRGAHALTDADIRHFTKLLLLAVAQSDDYADSEKARSHVSEAVDRCEPKARREILREYALRYDGATAVRNLCNRAGMPAPASGDRSADDSWFWVIADALNQIPMSPENRWLHLHRISETCTDPEFRDRNVAYLRTSPWGALVAGDDEQRAAALRLLQPTEINKDEA